MFGGWAERLSPGFVRLAFQIIKDFMSSFCVKVFRLHMQSAVCVGRK